MFLNYFLINILSLYFLQINALLKCYKCDSKTLKICATDPLKLNNEFISCSFSDCAVTVVDGITYRGCASEVPKKSDNIYYKTCKTQLCNNIIYPPGRLKCHQCDGASCVSKQIASPKPCLKFLENSDQCFTNVINQKSAIRGCTSDNNITLHFPKFCDTNGCNNIDGILNTTCIQCNSKESFNCKRNRTLNNKCEISNLEECTVNYLLGRPTETCYTYHKFDEVERGCTSLFDKVYENKTKYFNKCKGQYCNNQCLNITQCVICNTNDRPDCENQAHEYLLQKCSPKDSSCYAHLNLTTKNIIRDCGLPKELTNSYQCQENGCNSRPFRYCYDCNSERNPECSQWQNEKKISRKICETPDQQCITLINKKQHTVRGCESVIFNCNNSGMKHCNNCTGNLCNAGIFPEKRLKCYQCTDSGKFAKLIENKLTPCLLYDENDKCFEYANSKNQMVRDCKSNINKYNECIEKHYKCLICNQNKCNNHNVFYKTNLTCHSCYDDGENLNSCGWAQMNETSIKCQSQVIFYSEATCFSKYNYINGSIDRGCSWDKKICLNKDNENCNLCMKNNCNMNNYLYQTCIQCRSNNTGEISCGNSAAGIKATLCRNSKHLYETRGCFTKIEANNVVTRGCAADLSGPEFANCQQITNPICNYCVGSNCNIMEAPKYFSGNSKISFDTIYLIFGIAKLFFSNWIITTNF